MSINFNTDDVKLYLFNKITFRSLLNVLCYIVVSEKVNKKY